MRPIRTWSSTSGLILLTMNRIRPTKKPVTREREKCNPHTCTYGWQLVYTRTLPQNSCNLPMSRKAILSGMKRSLNRIWRCTRIVLTPREGERERGREGGREGRREGGREGGKEGEGS